MSLPKPFALLVIWLLAGFSLSSLAQHEKRGIPVTEEQLAGFDLIIAADGSGLPDGSGTAAQGEIVYNTRCQACHGAKGEGANPSLQLVGGDMQSSGTPIRTVGSYWPLATTIYDYVRRAMPADAPKSLSDIEIYQVTAYLLFMNQIIARDYVLDKNSLPAIAMPNKSGFIDQSHIQ